MSDNGVAGPHPDLRTLYCDSLNQLREQIVSSGQQFHAPSIPVDLQPDDLTIRCQRTWYDIETPNPAMNGADFSVAIVQFAAGGKHFSYFIEAAQLADADEWRWAGTSGGERPRRALDESGGFMLAGGEYVCVGGLTKSRGRFARLLLRLIGRRRWEQIQVAHADGTTYTAEVEEDGGCIVFAPVVRTVSADDHVIVRYLDAGGREVRMERTWIGDGGPPPAEMFQRLAER